MTRPTTRVLAVLELLQSQGRVSGPELALRVGVDGRTLRRYIAMLEELGVPIVAERGRFGGYALVAGFKLPPMIFTDDEALALSVGLLAARGLGLADAAPAVAGAQAKLQRVMPPALKRRLRAIDETVALDLSRGNASPEDNAALVTLSAAAQARQRVHLDYRSGEQQTTARDFDPYGLVWRGGRWYAVGHCHLRRDVRSFRLDRVIAVRALPASFGRPDDYRHAWPGPRRARPIHGHRGRLRLFHPTQAGSRTRTDSAPPSRRSARRGRLRGRFGPRRPRGERRGRSHGGRTLGGLQPKRPRARR